MADDMGNKMCGGKKCDFMININVAATTAVAVQRDRESMPDHVKRLEDRVDVTFVGCD